MSALSFELFTHEEAALVHQISVPGGCSGETGGKDASIDNLSDSERTILEA
jgi:hypothetical protein